MARKVTGYIKRRNPEEGIPSPRSVQALGQQGVNIMEFCKAVHCAERDSRRDCDPGRDPGSSDRQLHVHSQDAPASVLIRKAAALRGAGTPNTSKVGRITRKQLEDVAKVSSRI